MAPERSSCRRGGRRSAHRRRERDAPCCDHQRNACAGNGSRPAGAVTRSGRRCRVKDALGARAATPRRNDAPHRPGTPSASGDGRASRRRGGGSAPHEPGKDSAVAGSSRCPGGGSSDDAGAVEHGNQRRRRGSARTAVDLDVGELTSTPAWCGRPARKSRHAAAVPPRWRRRGGSHEPAPLNVLKPTPARGVASIAKAKVGSVPVAAGAAMPTFDLSAIVGRSGARRAAARSPPQLAHRGGLRMFQKTATRGRRETRTRS